MIQKSYCGRVASSTRKILHDSLERNSSGRKISRPRDLRGLAHNVSKSFGKSRTESITKSGRSRGEVDWSFLSS
jgi:hypothetical protein